MLYFSLACLENSSISGSTACSCASSALAFYFRSNDVHRDKAYQWENYRYASNWVNAVKKLADDAVLDPHKVGDGWFKIELPSLHTVLGDGIPVDKCVKARFTLKRLRLGLSMRYALLQRYAEGIDLAVIMETAPLLGEDGTR